MKACKRKAIRRKAPDDMLDQREPRLRFIKAGDTTLAYHEWPAEPGADTLLIVHATGFHGRCYDAIAMQFPDHRVIAADMHGHGASSGGPVSDWQIIVDELTAVIDHLGLEGAIGMGHSMGAHVTLRTAAKRGHAFRSLVLFDPVILAPEFYAAGRSLIPEGQIHPAAKRKRDFASPEEMIERFEARDPYQLFRRDVFESYCRHGLAPLDEGGFELACPPEVEASLYMTSLSGAAALEAAGTLQVATTIVRAMQSDIRDFKASPTWPGLADSMPNAVDLDRSDMTHFHPFQDPDDAARIIREAMNASEANGA